MGLDTSFHIGKEKKEYIKKVVETVGEEAFNKLVVADLIETHSTDYQEDVYFGKNYALRDWLEIKHGIEYGSYFEMPKIMFNQLLSDFKRYKKDEDASEINLEYGKAESDIKYTLKLLTKLKIDWGNNDKLFVSQW